MWDASNLAEDLRVILRLAAGRGAQPTAVIIDSRTLRSTPESGARAAYDGAKRKKGSKLHLAVDTLGHLLALHVTPANTDDRAEVGRIAKAVQAETGENVKIAFVDQGYNQRPLPLNAALPSRSSNCRRPSAVSCCCPDDGSSNDPSRGPPARKLVKDYERCAQTLADLHLIAFVCIMLKNVAKLTRFLTTSRRA